MCRHLSDIVSICTTFGRVFFAYPLPDFLTVGFKANRRAAIDAERTPKCTGFEEAGKQLCGGQGRMQDRLPWHKFFPSASRCLGSLFWRGWFCYFCCLQCHNESWPVNLAAAFAFGSFGQYRERESGRRRKWARSLHWLIEESVTGI